MENNLEKEILSAVKGKNQENNVREMIGVYKMLKVFLKIPEKIEKDEKDQKGRSAAFLVLFNDAHSREDVDCRKRPRFTFSKQINRKI